MDESSVSSPLTRIGYLYPYFPPEVLHALGRVPVRLLPWTRDTADAEPYLHKNFCALSKALLARFMAAGPSTDLEGVILADVCDAQRRLHDVWRAYVPVPALTFLDIPRRSDAIGQEYFVAALTRGVSQLEASLHRTLTADALAASIRLYNRQRELWQALRAAWVAGRVSTEKYYALREVRSTRDPVSANSELEQALAEAPAAPASPAPRPRLLLMGSLAVHLGLVDAIQADGRAQIVAEDSACDERTVEAAIPAEGSREELLRALALQYQSPPAPRRRDLPHRLAYLGRLAETRGVNGVICSYFKFCDLYLTEFPIVKRFFEQRKIRVLLLEDEGEPAFSGQARTRLEAFLEMLLG